MGMKVIIESLDPKNLKRWFVHLTINGGLKAIGGSSFPLKVFPSIGAEDLFRRGAEKMAKFNSD